MSICPSQVGRCTSHCHEHPFYNFKACTQSSPLLLPCRLCSLHERSHCQAFFKKNHLLIDGRMAGGSCDSLAAVSSDHELSWQRLYHAGGTCVASLMFLSGLGDVVSAALDE